jgi:hypothetical protein
MKKPTALATGLAVAVAVTVPAYTAYAAGNTSPAKPSASTSHASSPSTKPKPSVTPYSPPAAPEGATPPEAKAITPSGHFNVRVDPTGKKPMDDTWPSATDLFTQAELQQVMPSLTGVTAAACHTGDLPGGGSTTKPTTCTLNLQISGESNDDRSKLMVNIRGFGLPQQVGKQWTKDLAQARARSAKRPGLYTFYPNKSFGTSAAYTDGTTTKVLVQHGDVAGEIWFSGIGFTTLNSDYLKSRRAYRTAVVPSLVQLLGAKLTTTAKATA